MNATTNTITELLRASAEGDRGALDQLFGRVYPEVKRLARRVRSGRAPETLGTTALANEAYLKLAGGDPVDWESRSHFFAVAARAMRQVIVDQARRRMAEKRGGGAAWAVTLDESLASSPMRASELIDLDAALDRLASVDPRRARVVEQRFFGGLTNEETAAVLGVSTATVERDWRAARAWLAVEMGALGRG